MYKDKTEDDENADKSENTEETLEDEVNENDIKILRSDWILILILIWMIN